MARTTKTTTTKVAPKAKVQPEPEAPRENRYTRSAKVIVSNLSIDVQQLSQQADMSLSTSRHCLEAWNGITQVLLQHGAISQAWRAKLSPKNDTKAEAAPEPVPAK